MKKIIKDAKEKEKLKEKKINYENGRQYKERGIEENEKKRREKED